MKGISQLLEKYQNKLLVRKENASKGDYGKLLIIGGSFGMSGAAYLSGLAAFRSGIGMVRFYGPECNRQILQTLLPEAMYTSDCSWQEDRMEDQETEPEETKTQSCSEFDEKLRYDMKRLDQALKWADAVICGPGLSQSQSAKAIVSHLFQCDLSSKELVLLDADALNIISSEKFRIKELSLARSRKGKESNVVVTPHIGEMSRLTGAAIQEIKKNPEKYAAALAGEENCTVVLKDHVSHTALPGGKTIRNESGCSALAKAGSGDVLCGVIAGITEVIGGDAMDGAVLGTFFHGRAGEVAALYHGVHSTLARDVADAVSGVIGSQDYPVQEEKEGK